MVAALLASGVATSFAEDPRRIEARRGMIHELEQARARSPEDTESRLRLAVLYDSAGFRSNARRELEAVLERSRTLDPERRREAAVRLARSWLDEARREGDPTLALRGTAVFDTLLKSEETLARSEILLLSRLQFLSMGAVRGDHLRRATVARSCTKTVLARDPNDADALLLDALYALSLGALDEARRAFRRGIRALSDPAERAVFEREPERDPEPFATADEQELERWANLVRADILYGDPEHGRRGWDTDLGRLLASYGPPRWKSSEVYRHWGAVEEMGQPTRILGGQVVPAAVLEERLPWREVTHIVHGRPVTLRLEDASLSGNWRLAPESAQDLAEAEARAPAGPAERRADPWAVDFPFVRVLAFRDSIQGSGAMGVDLRCAYVDETPDGGRHGKVKLTAEVLDAALDPAGTVTGVIRGHDWFPLPGGGSAAFVATRLSLLPGRYTLLLHQRARGTERDARPIPFYVPDLERHGLLLSDLELAYAPPEGRLPPATRRGVPYLPEPNGRIRRGERFDLLFEVYGLVPGPGGTARMRTSYAVLPLHFARAVIDSGGIPRVPGPEDAGLTRLRRGKEYIRIEQPMEILRSGGRPVLKVVRRFELPPELEPGPYVLIVEVKDGSSDEGPSAVGRIPFTLVE